MKADLHTHTTASDGREKPERLVDLAVEKGLSMLAITDHDTLDGYRKAKSRAEERGLELISGIENTVLWRTKEVHLLAYFFDADHPEVMQFVARQKRARRLRMEKIVAKLRRQGVDITMDEVLAEAYGGNVGRPHAAAVLIRKRVVGSVPEAFVRYLNEQMLQIQTEYASIDEAIGVFHRAGGVLSLAHPGRMFKTAELLELLEHDMDAIELVHPSHPDPIQKRMKILASRFRKALSGGSDFHGFNEKGSHPFFGIATISADHVSNLREKSFEWRSRMADVRTVAEGAGDMAEGAGDMAEGAGDMAEGAGGERTAVVDSMPESSTGASNTVDATSAGYARMAPQPANVLASTR